MNPYEILGITPDADAEAIKKAFRDMSKTAHPDMDGGSEKAFINLKNAYECLTDPVKKRMFDDLGVMPGSPEFSLIDEAMQYIAMCFGKMITEIDLETFKRQPLIAVLVSIAEKERLDHDRKLLTLVEARKRCQQALEIVAKQCKKKKENSPNLFIKVLEGKLAEVETSMVPERRATQVMGKAIEILQEYEFSPD